MLTNHVKSGGGSVGSLAHFKGKETLEAMAAKVRPSLSPS